MAVSYTHLDVYKRQPEELAEKLQILECGLEDTVIELVKVFYFMQFLSLIHI